ncbi:MAG: hypothetical protein AAFV07_07325 [Bacteroidota bacterium]
MPNPSGSSYEKFFLRTLIVGISISALVGITILLVKGMGNTGAQLLQSGLALAGFSLTGLCSAFIYDQKEDRIFSIAGMIISILGFLITLAIVWDIISQKHSWWLLTIFLTLSIGIGQITLLLGIQPQTYAIRWVRAITMFCVAVTAGLPLHAIWHKLDTTSFPYAGMGIFAILAALGTIVTPVWNRKMDKSD